MIEQIEHYKKYKSLSQLVISLAKSCWANQKTINYTGYRNFWKSSIIVKNKNLEELFVNLENSSVIS